MKRQYDPAFITALKKTDVMVSNRFKKRIAVFAKNPLDPELHNHELHSPYKGLRSIDITNDYRAIYQEKIVGKENLVF